MSVKKTLILMVDEYGDKPYGWDGDGALPVRRDALELIHQMFHDPELDSRRLERCQDSSALMSKDGTVEITLDYEGREVLLCFQCGSAVTYVQFFEDDETTLDGLIRVRDPSEAARAARKINDLLRWLVREDK